VIAPPLASVLARPEALVELAPHEWERLLLQARRTNLIARIAIIAKEGGLFPVLPPRPRAHLEAACNQADWRHRTVRWEVDCIRRALAPLGIPVVLLKGAAYLLAGLPAARGRIFSDVDIMVPRERLADVERALLAHGWASQGYDAYDQNYYRRWMHELPPLQHVLRQTAVDVHHTIAPLTARIPVDAAKLYAAAHPLDIEGRFLVLAPSDMVLHSIIHLFQEGEFEHGLRDLVDIDDLLRHFGRDPGFWHALEARASELGLGRPLYYAAAQARDLLQTPMPEGFLAWLERIEPGEMTRGLMRAAFRAGILGDAAEDGVPFAGPARSFLYLRGHYLRMPLRLLVPHLVRKGFRRQAEA
jgi:Uncharacterised nucleotidyltransferase